MPDSNFAMIMKLGRDEDGDQVGIQLGERGRFRCLDGTLLGVVRLNLDKNEHHGLTFSCYGTTLVITTPLDNDTVITLDNGYAHGREVNVPDCIDASLAMVVTFDPEDEAHCVVITPQKRRWKQFAIIYAPVLPVVPSLLEIVQKQLG